MKRYTVWFTVFVILGFGANLAGLAFAGEISGKVTLTDEVTPVNSAYISAVGSENRDAWTDQDGAYSLSLLGDGTWNVRVMPPSSSDYTGGYWKNADVVISGNTAVQNFTGAEYPGQRDPV